MIKERVKECIVAFDPSYIKKSGKHTFGLGIYWSGCANRAKWVWTFAVLPLWM